MLERIATRRRLRRRRRERDALLLDLGALVFELHRQGRRAPDLLQRKAAELNEVEDQVRALDAELAGDAGQEQWSAPTEGEPLESGLADGAAEGEEVEAEAEAATSEQEAVDPQAQRQEPGP